MTIGEFLDSAEFVNAHIIIFDKDDNVVFEDEDGYSPTDPSSVLPDGVADMWLDFWLLESDSSYPTLKIFA